MAALGLYFFVISIAVLSASAKNQSYENKIVGGTEVNINDYSYQVSLQGFVGTKFQHVCGATLIKMDHVVTAAHCVYYEKQPVDPSLFRVVAGANNWEDVTNGEIAFVEAIIPHSQYSNEDAKFDSDIAILKLKSSFTMPMLNIITLRRNPTSTGELCTITGWGKLNKEQEGYSNHLLKMDTSITEHSMCKNAFSEMFTDNMICASGKPTQTICYGDTGGPLVCDGELVGIVTYSVKICDVSIPMSIPIVFTEIAEYVHWIDAITSGAGNFYLNVKLIIIPILSLYLLS